jgi:hypothetical protein
MTSLEKKVIGYYDKKRSVSACTELYELSRKEDKTKEDVARLEWLRDEAYESVLPILGIIIRKHFNSLQPDDLDDLVQLSALEFWKVISGNKPPMPYSDAAHFNFYFKVGIRAMIKAMHANKSAVFDLRDNNAMPPVASFNFQNPEQAIFLTEIPNLIYERVMGRVRFEGEEYDVCDYIARCLIFREDDVKRFKIRKISGKVTNAQFFEEYVGMLIKSVYDQLREEINISDMLTDEGAPLNAIFYTQSHQSQ